MDIQKQITKSIVRIYNIVYCICLDFLMFIINRVSINILRYTDMFYVAYLIGSGGNQLFDPEFN